MLAMLEMHCFVFLVQRRHHCFVWNCLTSSRCKASTSPKYEVVGHRDVSWREDIHSSNHASGVLNSFDMSHECYADRLLNTLESGNPFSQPPASLESRQLLRARSPWAVRVPGPGRGVEDGNGRLHFAGSRLKGSAGRETPRRFMTQASVATVVCGSNGQSENSGLGKPLCSFGRPKRGTRGDSDHARGLGCGRH